jgi:hypothetical protein
LRIAHRLWKHDYQYCCAHLVPDQHASGWNRESTPFARLPGCVSDHAISRAQGAPLDSERRSISRNLSRRTQAGSRLAARRAEERAAELWRMCTNSSRAVGRGAGNVRMPPPPPLPAAASSAEHSSQLLGLLGFPALRARPLDRGNSHANLPSSCFIPIAPADVQMPPSGCLPAAGSVVATRKACLTHRQLAQQLHIPCVYSTFLRALA